MIKTVEVELLGAIFTVEVEVYGPTVDDWIEKSIKSEGDLMELLQYWSQGPRWKHYDELIDMIAGKLRDE